MPASLKVIDVGTRKGTLNIQATSKAVYEVNDAGESVLVNGGQFTQVYSGPAQNQWAGSLHPGHYTWLFRTEMRDDRPRRRRSGSFYHGISPQEFSKLQFLKARVVRVMATSDGVRWSCDFPGGCDHESSTEIGAYEHELEHMGKTLEDALATPEMVEEAQYQAATAAKKEKRKIKKESRAAAMASALMRGED